MSTYIGICDFPDAEQVLFSADHFDRLCTSPKMSNRKLMVGVMMSYKTLHGLPSKWTAAWPKPNEVRDIFTNHPRVLNTLHYADFDGVSDTYDLINSSLYGGENLHALQLDMIWPEPKMIQDFREFHPKVKIVLQVNSRSLEAMDNNPTRVVTELMKYGFYADYVLLDKSHGKGLGMDAHGLLPYLREISKNAPHLRIAVAGGLGPETMHLVEPIVKEFPNVSIDAQGRLRPSGNSLHPIDWEMADRYLVQAVRMFS